jgi:hypothetical protein
LYQLSIQVTKHIGKVDGVTVWDGGIYTVLNQYEEIRMQTFMPTKSLDHLTKPFTDLQRSLEMFGHKMPELFFTDNVDGECKYLERVFPSLLTNVRHPVTQPPSHLPALEIPNSVNIATFNDINRAELALSLIIGDLIPEGSDKITAVGFDAEWDYNPATRVNIIELCCCMKY